MKRDKLKQKVPVGISILIIVGMVTFAAGVSYSELEKQDHPPVNHLGTGYCIQCHADAKTLAKMREKQGISESEFQAQIKSNAHGNIYALQTEAQSKPKW